MKQKNDVFQSIRANKTWVIIIAVALFLLELEIFAVAAMKSGRQSRLHVLDRQGILVYETDGRNLSSFDKYYFEKTFGPFENYTAKLVSKDVPFPFRAWFAAAVGLPIGLVLLFVFVVKAYAALFYGEEKQRREAAWQPDGSETRLEGMLMRISRFNIFTIGFLVFVLIFSYWVIPNAVSHLAEMGLQAVSRYKIFLLAAAGVFVCLAAWVIYLRYLLAKQSIAARTEVDKYRLELEYHHGERQPPKLIGNDAGRQEERFGEDGRLPGGIVEGELYKN